MRTKEQYVEDLKKLKKNLYYNGEKGEFELEAIEDDCFFDGEPVQFEVSKGTDKPYIEIEGD